MEKFKNLRSIPSYLSLQNIDTDMIIPKQFLKTIKRTGLGMNPDQLKPKERCASTSNRNFEGRQGRGGRTHLVSPGMAIAAAIKGHLADVREI